MMHVVLQPNPLEMSFHYPLHRYFAAFLCQAINVQRVDIEDIIPPTGFLHTLMIHPLHLLVFQVESYLLILYFILYYI